MNDSVVALPVLKSKLRLYCLRLTDKILVLGNGDVKNSRTYEENDTCLKLYHNYYDHGITPIVHHRVNDVLLKNIKSFHRRE